MTEGLVWLDLVAPSPDVLAELGHILRLDSHTLEDALSVRERPKIVHLGSYAFLTTYAAWNSSHRVMTSRISAYILDTALITIRQDDSAAMNLVVERWRQDQHLPQWGVHGLLQGLLDVIVDFQFEVLENLDVETDDLSRELFSERPDLQSLQRRTFQVRGHLVALHRIIPQTRDIVASILRQSLAEEWPLELRAYWEDINDHVLRASEWVDALRDLIASIFEASLALNDSRMNEVMKKLAAWAAIIAVPTMITGWFGMNIPYPGFSATSGLVLAVALILASVGTLVFIFKRNNWL
jgi:magnesium transporter